MKISGVPEKVTMDKGGAIKAAMDEINATGDKPIIVGQVNCLNNIVEQDHRGSKASHQANAEFQVISIRQMCTDRHRIDAHMIRKAQLLLQGCIKLSCADQFYALAGQIRIV